MTPHLKFLIRQAIEALGSYEQAAEPMAMPSPLLQELRAALEEEDDEDRSAAQATVANADVAMGLFV